MNSDNPLNRFLSAQQPLYSQVLKELRNAKKTTHWMWFFFPQIEGLGNSPTAKYYSIKSIEEAKEYIAHPALGKRLLECTNILLQIENKTADEIFGSPDNLKLRSCMTLFNFVVPGQKVFADALQKYFAGEEDEKTIAILKQMNNAG